MPCKTPKEELLPDLEIEKTTRANRKASQLESCGRSI